MKNYYNILEVTPEAGSEEIKKAYFKLVRKYPPDKNPDKFKEIREAYDKMQDEDFREEFKRVQEIPSHFREVYLCAREFEEKKEFHSAINVCLEGLRVEPDQLDLNQYLVQLYLKNEQIGKAIKRLEKLVSNNKDNGKLEALLAVTYYHRGWNKKAALQFEKAYGLGEKSEEFLTFYAMNSMQQKQYDYARELAVRVLDENTYINMRQKKLFSAVFSVLFLVHLKQSTIDKRELFDRMDAFLKDSKENEKLSKSILCHVLESVSEVFDPRKNDTAILEYLADRLHQLKDLSKYESSLLLSCDFLIERTKILKDKRLGDIIRDAMETFFEKALLPMQDFDFLFEDRELAELDIKLMIIDEYNKLKKELEIIKADYPFLRNEMSEFLEELERNDNKTYLWNKYEKVYCKKAGYPKGGHLVRSSASSDERAEAEEEFSFYQEPYKREEPKVGRNDPCPCGSGKKYKKCCGR